MRLVAGMVTIAPGDRATTTLLYTVYVFDRYNWDADKSTPLGPGIVSDAELGRLHQVGLAREFVVRGRGHRGLLRSMILRCLCRVGG